MEYNVDETRMNQYQDDSTGIYVRAKLPNGKLDSVDILWLTKESLLNWLRSRDEKNEWAENVVGILLGHGNITC